MRVQDSKNALFEEVILDLPAPQQNQQINQNNNVPQKSNAPLVYNRMNPTTRVHIESVRTSFRDAIKQANDIVVIIRNLTPKERKNVDLDSALYMKRFKDILTKGIKSGSVLQKELVAQYIDKKDTYDYHVAFVEDLYNKKDKLKTNSYNERISWSDSIISELKTMFEDLIGEKLN